MSRGGVPVWLCSWPGRISRYVNAKDAETARRKCEASGWGRPPENTRERSWVKFAGYGTTSAVSSPGPVAPRARKNAPKIAASGRRAELALTIYGLLRLDWPIGSILSSASAEARWQASNATLRDFVANVGAAMSRLSVSSKTLEDVVEADALAWWWSGREKNHRRRGHDKLQEYAREKRELFRERVRRLRKRKEYVVAIGELTSILNGQATPEGFNEHMLGYLTEHGFTTDDAADLLRRGSRVGIPRW